jgi:amino acid adenylation domain-containing protein/FkbM family methyltransferase
MTVHRERAETLHRLIEEQVTRTPTSPAVCFEGHTLTYEELDRRANALAASLIGLGVRPDCLVALLVHRSVDMIVGILATLKAGGAYLPIDPGQPTARVHFILDDANPAVLLTGSTLLDNLPHTVAPTICLDTFDWTRSRRIPGDVGVTPADLAYVIYTSGSTGQPKGVCIEHRNIVNYVLGVAERFGFEAGMHHATVSTIAADLGNTVVFPSLVTGGCLHVISHERAESGALLAEYFARERIDVLKIVPSHLAALQAGNNPAQVMPRRRLILGGEAARPEWIRQLRRSAPECEIYNHYGPTETTVGVLTYHIEGLPPASMSTVPLGRALPNSVVRIIDSSGAMVPIGDEGELCVSGAGVARGYLNRADQTAMKFVADPARPDDPSARMYRTGDRARYLPDGNVEFLGRIDDQIKLHGNRIEPAEIERALREMPGVRDAVVLARSDESGAPRLAAYLVPDRGDQPLWDEASVHILPDGSAVAHLNRNETDYIYNEIFVLQAYLRHGITINDGDVIVDAGANIGLFTVFTSRIAANLKVLAFEPNPATFACLSANARAYGAEVTCFPFGLSREDKSADLTFFTGLSLLSGVYADAATEREVVRAYVLNQHTEAPDKDRIAREVGDLIDDRLQAATVAVQLRTLSGVMAEHTIDRIDLLKINVEKSELDVLLGLSERDWPKIRQLVIEVDTESNLHPIVSLLSDHGFDVAIEQDELLHRTHLRYVYAIRQSGEGPRLIRHQFPGVHVRSIEPATHGVLTPASLRRHLTERLPHYMVPSSFVLMDRLPLTANGKIDRQALLSVIEPSAASRRFEAPRTETERALAAIWTELLQVPNVGVHDDFFDLGGQSLMAIRAVAQIRDAFSVDISLRNMFEQPTLGGLAELIDGLVWISTRPRTTSAGDREEIAL